MDADVDCAGAVDDDPGLSLFYAGMVRSKNALSVMMQCFVITCLVTVLWVVYLYALAFGTDVGGIIGNLDKAFHNGITFDTLKGTIPESVFSTFQLTFAIITPALIVGAFAERMKFSRADLVHGLVGHARIRTDRALGLGWRLARRHGRSRLRRRHGRSHQRRYRRSRGGADAGQASRLSEYTDQAAATWC